MSPKMSPLLSSSSSKLSLSPSSSKLLSSSSGLLSPSSPKLLSLSSSKLSPSSPKWLSRSLILILIMITILSSQSVSAVTISTLDGTCGRRPIDENLLGRIVGGFESKFGEVPWQGSLKEKRWLSFLSYRKCGVVLIDNLWALTAAHCVSRWYFSDLVVIFGTNSVDEMNSNETCVERKVKHVHVHPLFNSVLLEDDIALLELESPINYSISIQPICLPVKDQEFTGKEAYVSGFGFTKYRAGILPSILQVVNLPIMSNSECREMYLKAGFRKNIPPTALCAGYAQGGKDSCEGDSGGPLMVTDGQIWTLAGIVSNGIKCAEPNLPGVYARISEYLDWIDSHVNRKSVIEL